jgi:hypothetical protein
MHNDQIIKKEEHEDCYNAFKCFKIQDLLWEKVGTENN